MTVRWTGAFDGLPNWPPDHAGQGWSNIVSGAAALHARTADDGNYMGSAIWSERYGNCNFILAQSRRLLFMDTFIGTGVNDTAPETNGGAAGYTNQFDTANSGGAIDVYGITPSIRLMPNTRRGVDQPARVEIQVSAWKSAIGGADHKVRIYAVPSWNVLAGWGVNNVLPRYPYVEWTLNSATPPATPGWSTSPATQQSLDIATGLDLPGWEWRNADHDEVVAGEGAIDVRYMACHFVIAGYGNGAAGPYIAALEIWEEAVAV